MAFCPPPALIPSDPPLFAASDPGFGNTASGDLGDIDGFFSALDALLNLPLGAIDADLAALSTLDGLLAAAAYTPGAWLATSVAPLIAEYATLTLAGDAMQGVVMALLAAQAVVPEPPIPPPNPGMTLQDLCGNCNEGGTTIVEVMPDTLPGYNIGFDQGTPGGGNCLNPQAGGGYAPGPCPSETAPAPQPPAPTPPPAPPPEPDPPPPTPPDQGGDSGDFGSAGGGGGDVGTGGAGDFDFDTD
jgi:hypothetical protein